MLQRLRVVEKVSVDALVRDALEATEHNQKEAREWIWTRALSDEAVRHAFLSLGIDQAIRSYFNRERGAALYEPREVEETPELRARRAKKMERRLFWDRYSLFGQKPLKIAKQGDLRDSVMKRRDQAKTNMARASFEEDIMKRLPNKGVAVGKFFHVDKVIEIAKAHHAFS